MTHTESRRTLMRRRAGVYEREAARRSRVEKRRVYAERNGLTKPRPLAVFGHHFGRVKMGLRLRPNPDGVVAVARRMAAGSYKRGAVPPAKRRKRHH